MAEKHDLKKNDNCIPIIENSEGAIRQEKAAGDLDEPDVLGSTFGNDWPIMKWMKKHISCFKESKKKPGAVMPVDKNALFYNMNHQNRGIAMVLNHENFMSNMKLKARTGTDKDLQNLKSSLHQLGFEVRTYDDLTADGVEKAIERASHEDHTDNDCFLLACLSHGEQGILYAKDAPYKPETLWKHFTADKCPTLAGKPKLFFIQACQGDRLDGGVTLFKPTQVDSSPSYRIPTHADFLIAYSTIPGFYSWRNTSRGSWFMQALCDELNENGCSVDILTLLTFVNRRVAIDFESNVPDNSVMHAQKQIPSITFMLTRVLKFSPKILNNEVYQ